MLRIELPTHLTDDDFDEVARVCDDLGLAAEIVERDVHRGIDPSLINDVLIWVGGTAAGLSLEKALERAAVRVVAVVRARRDVGTGVVLRIQPRARLSFNFTDETMSAISTLQTLGPLDAVPDGDYYWTPERGWQVREP